MAFPPNRLYFLNCVFIVFSVYIITCCHFTTVHVYYLYKYKSHDSIVTHFIIVTCLLMPFYIRFANTQLVVATLSLLKRSLLKTYASTVRYVLLFVYQYIRMSTDGHVGSFSSTPPRQLPPPAKRMRLAITRIESTHSLKRKTHVLRPLAKRFSFTESDSSSSSSPRTPPILYGSSPDRKSPDLLEPQVSSSQSSCSLALETWCADSPGVTSSFAPSVVLNCSSTSRSLNRTPPPGVNSICSYSISPSQVALPSSSPSLSPTNVPLPDQGRQKGGGTCPPQKSRCPPPPNVPPSSVHPLACAPFPCPNR